MTVNGANAGLAGPQRSRVASSVVVFDGRVDRDAVSMTLALYANAVSFAGAAEPASPRSVATSGDRIGLCAAEPHSK